MFSRKNGKLVFIDMGFADLVEEECGFKTLTSFQGTLNYVSPEMSSILYRRMEKGLVDLYYNDLFGLIKSYQEMRFNDAKK